MSLPSSQEWRNIFQHARDIAVQLQHDLNSVHILLGFFLASSKSSQLLQERGINLDSILAQINNLNDEPPQILDEISQRSNSVANKCNSLELDSLHILIAITRVRNSLAYQALERCRASLTNLRNLATSYLTGRVQRSFVSSHNSEVVDNWSDELQGSLKDSEADQETLSEGGRELTSQDIAYTGKLNPKRFPWLSRLGRNLTEMALEGKLDPVIGRERELNEVVDILGKRRANNPCLLGEPGVGKTAIVEGLALYLARQKVSGLSDKIIVELDMGSLLAGTQLRGSLAEKLKGIKEEVKQANGQIIVFIDELHTLVRAGATGDSAQDASNDLKAALSRGEFPCIGATTIQDYKTYIEQDPALVRRFHQIWVEEPSLEDAELIVNGVIEYYANYHRVYYLPEAIKAAVRLSAKYINNRRLPAKAIDIIDLAGSCANRSQREEVDILQVVKSIAYISGVQEEHLFIEDPTRLLQMEAILSEEIVGHREQINRIASVLRRNYAGFNGSRPFGSFLFLGPPGVGKTEMAKRIASFLFGNDRAIMRIDMSEYQDSASVTRLIGAPPGYVGHDDGGQLTEAIRSRPYQLILLDEIEKAHRDVLMILLQLLDEGTLTDGKGRRVSFSQCVVVMTSNLGSDGKSIGFYRHNSSKDLENQMLESASKAFPPELWSRIDEQLVFTALQEDELLAIAQLLIDKSAEKLAKDRDIYYSVSPPVIKWLLSQGAYHPQRGARPMRSMIQRLLEAALSNLILSGEIQEGDQVEAVLNEHGKLTWICTSKDVRCAHKQTVKNRIALIQ